MNLTLFPQLFAILRMKKMCYLDLRRQTERRPELN